MTACDAHVLNSLDTVHHEVVNLFWSHHEYKSVWLPVIGEQLILEKEPAGQSTQWICSGSDKGFSDSGPNSVGKFIYRSHGILLHEGALLSAVLHLSYYYIGEGGKEKLISTM